MPVNVLFCEGGRGSPDIRVLRSILAGININVEPSGSKYGLGSKIKVYREAIRSSVIAGIRDSDFDLDQIPPRSALQEWRVDNNQTWLGWVWERNEIENYLIDPVIVSHTLGIQSPDTEGYRSVLQSSAESLAIYTAARLALSRSRGRFLPLPNKWGDRVGLTEHTLPANRTEADCRGEIARIIEDYGQRIQEVDVMERFTNLLPDHQPGGLRLQHALIYFSGKDLLCDMRADLERIGFASPNVFRERVLRGIEASLEDVWTWLPEWTDLRNQILDISSNQR